MPTPKRLAIFGSVFAFGCGFVMWGAAQGGYEWHPYVIYGAIIIGLALTVIFGSFFIITSVGWLSEEKTKNRFGRAAPLASKFYSWKHFQRGTFGVFALIALAIGGLIFSDMKIRIAGVALEDTLTLANVFASDFAQADCEAIRDERLALPTGDIETIRVRVCKKEQPHLVYRGHVFAAIYIPASHHTGIIIQHISRNLRDLLHGIPSNTLIGVRSLELDKLRVSQSLDQYWMLMAPVYLYCETPPINPDDLLSDLSETGNMPVEIRSDGYLETEKRRRGLNT